MTLAGTEILRAWERGQGQPPAQRALTLLACGFPARSRAELFTLSIGQRDALLLTLREQTFGPLLHGYAECPACGERLRFSARTGELRAAAPVPETEAAPALFLLCHEGWELEFRLPDSRDLIAAGACPNLESARQVLLDRCVQSARQDGQEVEPAALPPALYDRLMAALAEHDPQAEVLLSLHCPRCGVPWQAVFDIATYLWTEVAAQARRLLGEVAALARGYGWSESEILAMSPPRRRHYLELLGHG